MVKLIMVALLFSTLFIFDIDQLEQQLISQFNIKTSQVGFIIGSVFVAGLIILWFVLYLPFLSPLASMLYMRFTLKTAVPWSMAKQLSPFLSVHLPTSEWFPMLFIKELPEEKRMAALTEVINQPLPRQNNSRFDLFLREKLSKKAYNIYTTLSVIAVGIHAYCLIENSGWVGWLNRLQVAFWGDSYSPILSLVLASALSAFVAAGIVFLFDSLFLKTEE